ncbi:MAG TPA: response regulator transcription factor [Anaerolineales bacterium]|nr:response regulator transcription factor [Anaerolineales bacterium]
MRSILLVEDHSTFASVLVRLLLTTKDMQITLVATSAESALQELRSQRFDLVLVDVSLPEINGIALVGMIRDQFPGLPCLMLSGHALAHYKNRALDAGARGYILKDNAKGIIEGIRRVLNGEIYVSKELREG